MKLNTYRECVARLRPDMLFSAIKDPVTKELSLNIWSTHTPPELSEIEAIYEMVDEELAWEDQAEQYQLMLQRIDELAQGPLRSVMVAQSLGQTPNPDDILILQQLESQAADLRELI